MLIILTKLIFLPLLIQSKPVAKPGTLANKTLTTFSALTAKACASVDGKESKRKQLDAQMREKAAANARKGKEASTATTPFGYTPKQAPILSATKMPSTTSSVPGFSKMIQSKPDSTIKCAPANTFADPWEEEKMTVLGKSVEPTENAQTKDGMQNSPTNMPPLKPQVPLTSILNSPAVTKADPPCSDTKMAPTSSVKKITAAFPKATSVATASGTKSVAKKLQSPPPQPRPDEALMKKQLLSPLDTYEISDREGSDSESESESDEEESRGPKKKVCVIDIVSACHFFL